MKRVTPKQRERDKWLSFCARSGRSVIAQDIPVRVRRPKLYTPETFRLSDKGARKALFHLIEEAEDFLRQGVKVHISLQKTKALHPCGTLFFASHMERLAHCYAGMLSLSYPKNDVVEQLFQHIGLLGRFGLSSRKTISADNVKDWHFVRGENSDISGFGDLEARYRDTLGQELSMALLGSMSEAVTNCVHHAYPDRTTGGCHWWMFAQYKGGKLTVAIFDLGMGIAQSLRKKDGFAATIKELIRRFRNAAKVDEELLASAVGSNKSRTELPYRGKGLPEMLGYAKANKVGGLLIHSNHGAFSYSSEDSGEQHENYKRPLNGTLIEWTIPIDVEEV